MLVQDTKVGQETEQSGRAKHNVLGQARRSHRSRARAGAGPDGTGVEQGTGVRLEQGTEASPQQTQGQGKIQRQGSQEELVGL